jgi:hypothetical protein
MSEPEDAPAGTEEDPEPEVAPADPSEPWAKTSSGEADEI